MKHFFLEQYEGEKMKKGNAKLWVKILQCVVVCILTLLVLVCVSVFIQTKINSDKIPSTFGEW